MRVGKSIALAIILLFGFVMQCEIFQTNLGNFDTGEYLSVEVSYESESEREAFLSDIFKVSEKRSVHPFATFFKHNNEIEKVLSIYGDTYAREAIKKEQGISDRLYRSLSSGITQVEYREFQELSEMSKWRLYTVSFIGNKEDIYAVCDELEDSYQFSYPAIIGPNEYDMTWVIWVTIDVVLFMMNILCVAVRKKEVTVRISMGQDTKRIVLTSMVTELVIDLMLFFGVKAFCSLFISGTYMAKTVFGIYLAGIGISSLTYISFAVYDIRRAFSNVFVTKGIRNTIYALKFIVSVGTVMVIITNISLILQNRMSLGKMDFSDAYQDYSYLELVARNTPAGEDRSWEETYNINNRIYVENYETLKPVVSELILQDGDDGAKYVLVNEYGAASLEGFLRGMDYDEDADVIYFIPEKYHTDTTMEDARICLSHIITEAPGLTEQVVVYQDNRTFSYINRNVENNMSIIRNPVVIYARFHGADYLDRIHIEDTKNVMFRMKDKDIADIKETYSLEEKGYEVIVTKVTERFDYYNNMLKQGISFCSSVAIFILFLQIILTVTIVIMEYRNNSMEISLKKILGYSLLRRNLRIILFSVISNGIVMITAAVAGIRSGLYGAQAALKVGIMLLAIELGIEIINILKIEKENLLKTLKGGCL